MISIRLISKVSIFIVGLFIISGCVQKVTPSIVQLDNQLTGPNQLVDLSTGKPITPQQLIQRLAQSTHVIVGEKHDNLYHHQIEQWVAQEMQQVRPQGSVLLEMITPSQQNNITKVQAQMQSNLYIRDEKLQAAIKWNTGWPWGLYGNLVRHLLSQPYPLLSANLDKQVITEAYANPPVLKGQYSTQSVVQDTIRKTIKSSHGGELTVEQVEKMTVIQQMRNRAMAQALINAPKPALLYAGGYHATRAIGVPLHLQDLAPEIEFKVLIISEEGNQIENLHADYVWYTPKNN
ncbi:ChaN family lipoprotein [Providencia hangzhouensis]